MNYQHAFHAGNFADVHKHVVFTRILVHLLEKPAAIRVIDTHAGAGRYDLLAAEPSRSGEWCGGVGKLLQATPQGEPGTLLAPYLNAIAALNPGGALRHYPGSPVIAQHLLRAQDRLVACEFEARSAALLAATLRGDRRAKALRIDGWTALGAYVPPKEHRGVVLVDPPFEQPDEFARLSAALAGAHRKWPTGVYMLWYPIKERDAPDALARRLRRLAIPKVLRSEISLGPPRADAGLVGTGLIVVNPPFRLEGELALLLPTLAAAFSPEATVGLEWLARER